MSFLTSPGVEINEIDRTDVVPALSTSIGGYAGDFNWGPYNQIVSVSNEKELGSIFGTPTRNKSIANSFLTAASFLKYGEALRVVRTLNSGANTSRHVTGSIGLETTFNVQNYEQFETLTDLPSTIYARYPGELGNSIQVKIAYYDLSTTDYNNEFASYFDYKPDTTSYVENINSSIKDEIHILVIDRYGKISGTAGAVLEKYQGLSLVRDAKSENGSSLWYGDVVNRGSNYIYISSLDFIFNNADIIALDSPTTLISRNGNANITEASTSIATKVTVANTGFINGDDEILINSGNTVINKNIKIGIQFRDSQYTNLSGNSCRLILTSNPDLTGDPTVDFNVTNPSTTSFSMDVVVVYNDAHTITDIIEALNTDAGNTFTVNNVARRAYTFTAYIDELYKITTSDAALGDANSTTTTTRTAANVILDLTVTENVHAKIHSNLIPNYNYTNNVLIGAVNIFNFSGAVINAGALIDFTLVGGKDRATSQTTTLAADVISALEVIEYVDRDLLDINYIFAQQIDGDTSVDSKIYELVENRRDMIGFISAPISISSITTNDAKKTAVLNKFASVPSSSYLVFDSTPLYVYNKYQDNYSWIPACGHMAGLCANTDLISEPWFSPAGLNRGQLRGVTKLAFNPTQLERDDLYKNRINPIVSFPGQGIVLFGDKTALSKPSAFDRINVRRLFNIVERTVKRYAKNQLFEINDEFTRTAFVASVEPFLRDIRGRRGISDYRIVCDTTNNTSQIIDTNKFVGDIYIKPVRSINFISLNFIATRSGVTFNEIAG
jgi:phage tail sheath protein FI